MTEPERLIDNHVVGQAIRAKRKTLATDLPAVNVQQILEQLVAEWSYDLNRLTVGRTSWDKDYSNCFVVAERWEHHLDMAPGWRSGPSDWYIYLVADHKLAKDVSEPDQSLFTEHQLNQLEHIRAWISQDYFDQILSMIDCDPAMYSIWHTNKQALTPACLAELIIYLQGVNQVLIKIHSGYKQHDTK